MRNVFAQFNGVEVFFLICAAVGGTFVFIRLVLLLFGIGHDMDTDMGAHDGAIDGHHSDSDVGFKMLSLHSLTSFLMMFGLVGLAMYRQSKMGTLISMAGGLAAGAASVWVLGKLFTLFNKLQSSGTIPIESTEDQQGKVYLTIPENGTGRVLITVNNSLREYDAISFDNKKIETDTPIRVVCVEGNVLVVERI